MQEPTGVSLGPKVKIANSDHIYQPYQELKERLGPQKYNAVIVFGEGPVKRVFFSNEWEIIKKLYTPEQIKLWRESAEFTEFESLTDPKEKIQWLATKGPRTKKDPDFTVVDISAPGPSSFSKVDINPYFERIRQILAEPDPKTQEKLREEFRSELENKGRHSYKRYGELNAHAAGLLLYTGKTDKIILSGGRTIPRDKIEQGLGFPSEAELMRDLIIRIYGRKLYERDNPDVSVIADSDSPVEKEEYNERYMDYIRKTIHKYFIIEDSATNTIDNIIRSINHDPESFFNPEKSPQIGLLGNNHQVERCVTLLKLFFNTVINKLKSIGWRDYAIEAFTSLGLDFKQFENIDFKSQPDEMQELKTGLAKILADGGRLRQQEVILS